MAVLVFNNSVSVSTSFTPFFSQFDFHTHMNMLKQGFRVPSKNQFLPKIFTVQKSIQDNFQQAKKIQKEYFDKKARDAPEYKAGDWVWFLRHNIASTRPSGNKDFKRLGPFRIEIPLGRDVYRLILPKELSCVHCLFQNSLCLPFLEAQTFPNQIGS